MAAELSAACGVTHYAAVESAGRYRAGTCRIAGGRRGARGFRALGRRCGGGDGGGFVG